MPITVLVLALTAPAAALAIVGSTGDGDGTVSVKNGLGSVTLSPFNGSAVGRLSHGRIWITDPSPTDGNGAAVWGCDNSHGGVDLTDITTYCAGENIRFRAVGGRYKIAVRGAGIFLSAVGRGTVTLDGRGDDPSVESDGVFSVNDSPYRSLPNIAKPFVISVTTGG